MPEGSRLQRIRTEPVAGLQRESHVLAVIAHRPTETPFCLADLVLDRVLVHHQLFGGRLEAARFEEDEQGAAQASVVPVVGAQAR